MSAIYEALEKGILISDGAMGTMLQGKGLTDGGAPELWNVENDVYFFNLLPPFLTVDCKFKNHNSAALSVVR